MKMIKNRIFHTIYISIIIILWFSYAADFEISTNPSLQTAISGSMISLNVSTNNNTWIDSYITLNLPTQIEYTNSNIIPINNPALALWIETTPRRLLAAWQNINLTIQWNTIAQSFNTLDIISNIVDKNNLANVYTSAIANIDPIADITITKILSSQEPQFTWDTVSYTIEIKNIGSKIATWIQLVDVRPINQITFWNIWFINWAQQIPTIYNSLVNNFLFEINDINPWATTTVELQWTYDQMLNFGQTFSNQAFVLVESTQYSTTNDNISITNNVQWVADIYTNISLVSSWPSTPWDLVKYNIEYWNIWTKTATWITLQTTLPWWFSFVSSSIEPTNQWWSMISRIIDELTPNQNGSISLTWRYDWWITIWSNFISTTQISSPETELVNNNNTSSTTWTIVASNEMNITIYANNLSDNSRNTNTWTEIFAISGDLVQLEFVLTNEWNIQNTWNVSISNISNLIWYNWNTSWNIWLTPLQSQTIVITWIVWPQNFVSFTPTVNLNYNNTSQQDTVIVQEPLECGDWLITQNEPCDTNWQIWDLLPWQHCEELNWQCRIVTDVITNTVCMNYSTNEWNWQQCMNTTIDYNQPEIPETWAQCNSITAPSRIAIVDENNQWELEFTCNTQDNTIANEILIDCGNWDEYTDNWVSSFTHSCNYGYNTNWNTDDNTYNVRCYVDGTTVDNCSISIRVDEWFYGICGDWALDDWEECDLWWDEDEKNKIWSYLDLNRDYRAGRYWEWDYYCRNCRIRKYDTNDFAYQAPQCLWTNSSISVMENELMPFWRNIRNKQEQTVSSTYDCNDIDSDETKTIINKDSMKCTFSIYDGNNHQQIDNDPVNTFKTSCFEKDNSIMFRYFENTYNIDLDKASGKYIFSTNAIFDENNKVYWEYKIVLEKIEYEYCDPNTKQREEWRTYEWICESNFTLTRPYIMQISTFWVDPIATDASDFLKDFYNMKWYALIDSTDINETINVDKNDYRFNSEVSTQMYSFKNKYEPLSITVDNSFKVRWSKTIGDLFNNWVVKKVPNKLIFFIKWEWQLVLKQLTEFFPWNPFTIFVEWMDVLIEWSVITNGMIITDKQISFEDDSTTSYCEEWWQEVNWIFIAQWWFDSINRTRNIDRNNERCPYWNLHIKWVLIWDWVENLIDNRRSHLNNWFVVHNFSESAIKRERKDKIFLWAALLIEYNPSLWSQLPPWAESFTKTLNIYRQ